MNNVCFRRLFYRSTFRDHGLQADMVEAVLSVRRFLRPFIKSVLFGGLAGAVPMLIFTVPLGIYSLANGSPILGVLPSLGIAVLPIVVSVPVVFLAMVLFGLPLTLLLKRRRWERASVYILAGAALGLLLFITFLFMLEAPSGYWMALFGAAGGGVTGGTWWLYARRCNVR